MSNQIQNPNTKNKYDLAKRTSDFGAEVIKFIKKIPDNNVNRPLISQLIRSATSIGANYMEADCAESKKDFRHKRCRQLWREAHELTLIFSAIFRKK